MRRFIYYSIDKNPFHSTYGDVLQHVLTFDTIYPKRLENLFVKLAEKYANDTVLNIKAPFW